MNELPQICVPLLFFLLIYLSYLVQNELAHVTELPSYQLNVLDSLAYTIQAYSYYSHIMVYTQGKASGFSLSYSRENSEESINGTWFQHAKEHF